MRSTLLVLAFVSAVASAAHVESDPICITPKVTHCGIYLDAAAKIEITATVVDASCVKCSYDTTAMLTGAHTLKATHIVKDAAWGTLESTASSPLAFTKPGIPPAPVGLAVTP